MLACVAIFPLADSRCGRVEIVGPTNIISAKTSEMEMMLDVYVLLGRRKGRSIE